MTENEIDRLTERIIGCAYKVSNNPGIGFVEEVYENALGHDMRKDGLKVTQQFPINSLHDGGVTGEFVVDLLVEELGLNEPKAVPELNTEHPAQALNYLRLQVYPLVC